MPGRRQHLNVEFLNTLRDLTGPYSSISEFARACGKQLPNMSDYLRGVKTPEKRVLRSCLENVMVRRFGPFPICEICRIPEKRAEIPDSSGVYIIYDSGGNALYIGRASNFRVEVSQTLDRPVPTPIRLGPNVNKKDSPKMRKLAFYYSLYKIDSRIMQHYLEAMLLRAFTNQTHNTNLGSFN